MARNEVSLYLGNIDRLSPYFPYIKQRNGEIASRIAKYLGHAYSSDVLMDPPDEPRYIVPGATLDGDTAARLFIKGIDGFYGGYASDLSCVGKTVLHPTITGEAPAHHNKSFADSVTELGLVLPGFSAFNIEEGVLAYETLTPQFPSGLRIKAPNESDGNGQEVIKDCRHLELLLDQIGTESLSGKGVVIEPNIAGTKETTSAGQFVLGHDVYSFIASQQDDLVNGRNRYMGAHDVFVMRGTMEDLTGALNRTGDVRTHIAEKIAIFHDMYSRNFPEVTASRISYDYLEGADGYMNTLAGITDITARLGGTCPALIPAALHLQAHPHQEAVISQVNLNYQPAVTKNFERQAEVFLDQGSLRITAKIDRVI